MTTANMEGDTQYTVKDCLTALNRLGTLHLPSSLRHNSLAHKLLDAENNVVIGSYGTGKAFMTNLSAGNPQAGNPPASRMTLYTRDQVRDKDQPDLARIRAQIDAIAGLKPPSTPASTITPIPTASSSATPTAPPSPTATAARSRATMASIGGAEQVLRAYYAAVNQRNIARAYGYILPSERPGYAAFAQAYVDTLAATLTRLTPAHYITIANGHAATCIGFSLTALNKNAPSAPYGGWYMLEGTTRPAGRIANWQIVESGTRSTVGGQATVPPASACVPPSAFVLISGRTQITPLSAHDLAGPVKPLQRTEYDLGNLPYFYRVDVFDSQADAAASYRWQVSNVAGPFLPISHPAVPGERLYRSGNVLVAMVTTGNLQLFMNEQIAPAPAQVSPRAIAAALALEQRLIAQANGITVKPASLSPASATGAVAPTSTPTLTAPATDTIADGPPIFPPALAFIFPRSIVGGPTTANPASETNHPAKAVADTSYSINKGSLSVDYEVDIFRSSSDARQYDARQRAQTAKPFADGAYTFYPVKQPAAPGEWLAVSRHYRFVEVSAVLVYRNMVLAVSAYSDYDPNSPVQQKQVTQQAVQNTLSMEERLLARANAFAAHPIPTPLPLKSAEQARNRALRTELAYWDTFTVPCAHEAVALANELTQQTYSSLDALGSDADVVVNDCNDAEAAVFPIDPSHVPASPPPPPLYLTQPLADQANSPAFKKLLVAVELAAAAHDSFAANIQYDVELYRNEGPDFPTKIRQQLLSDISYFHRETLHAQDVLRQIEQKWRM